jgi:hydrogenase nickel incorporation protein HypA/HybF
MHEMSIAEALLEQVKRHLPPAAALRRVEVRVGPMRMIEPQAMQWAWQAVTRESPHAGAELQLQMLPWRLECPECQKRWDTADLFEACSCGCETAHPLGGDELELLALDIDEAPTPRPGPVGELTG